MTPEQCLLITEWRRALNQLAPMKELAKHEQELRKQVLESFFPAPKEGANHIDIFDGWNLNLSYKIDRKIDEAALPAIMFKLHELGINMGTVIVSKPALSLKDYREFQEINPEAGRILDEALIIKPGSHSLELTPPKAK